MIQKFRVFVADPSDQQHGSGLGERCAVGVEGHASRGQLGPVCSKQGDAELVAHDAQLNVEPSRVQLIAGDLLNPSRDLLRIGAVRIARDRQWAGRQLSEQ